MLCCACDTQAGSAGRFDEEVHATSVAIVVSRRSPVCVAVYALLRRFGMPLCCMLACELDRRLFRCRHHKSCEVCAFVVSIWNAAHDGPPGLRLDLATGALWHASVVNVAGGDRGVSLSTAHSCWLRKLTRGEESSAQITPGFATTHGNFGA